MQEKYLGVDIKYVKQFAGNLTIIRIYGQQEVQCAQHAIFVFVF